MDIYEKGDLSLTEEQEAVVTKRNTEVESLSSELHRSKANDTIQPVNKGSYEHSSTVLPAADRSSRPLFEGDATKQQTSLNITATFNRNINEKKASYEITPSVREVCPATRRDINAGYHASEMPANALTDTFCSTRPRDAVEDLYSIETQSPVNMAVTSSRQINEEKQLVGKGLTRLLDKKLVGDNASAVAVQRQEKTRVATQKRALPSNTQMVGQTTDRIRRGETGPTTFSATDLFIPGGGRKTKAKKRSHS